MSQMSVLCFYVFAVFRPASCDFIQYTMIIFSFILLYLVLPRAISSKSVHPFLEARFGELRINLLGMKAQHHIVNYMVDIAPGQKRESHQEARKHDMQWQLMTCKIYQARCCKMKVSEGWFDLFDPRLCHRQSAQLRGINRSSKNFWPKNRC